MRIFLFGLRRQPDPPHQTSLRQVKISGNGAALYLRGLIFAQREGLARGREPYAKLGRAEPFLWLRAQQRVQSASGGPNALGRFELREPLQ